MTEAEWLAWGEPDRLLEHLRVNKAMTRTKSGRRRFRLYACACCRGVWELILDEECRRAVEVTEAFADGTATAKEHDAARAAARKAAQKRWQTAHDIADLRPEHETTILWRAARAAELAADKQPGLVTVAGPIIVKDVSPRGKEEEKRYQVAIIRDLVGNPFHPIAVDPAWLTSTVVLLARGIHEEQAFDRLPILADALQDAGCDRDVLLDHCRDPNRVHVRGCWVIDRLLGLA